MERQHERGGFVPWFLQRASAVLLLFILGYHLYIQHFQKVGRTITFHEVSHHMLSIGYQWVDFSLLLLVLFHGLNGVRNVALDMGLAGRAERLATGGLWLVGLFMFVYGSNALWPFITGHPLF